MSNSKRIISSSSDEDEKPKRSYNLRPKKTRRLHTKIKKESSSESSDSDDSFIDDDEEDENYIELDIMDLLGSGLKNKNVQNDKILEEKYLDTLSKEEKDKLENIEKSIEKFNTCEIPLKYKILGSNLELKTKALLMQKVTFFKKLEPHNGEYFKLKKYMEGILNIPFKKYKGLNINTLLEKEKSFPEKIPLVKRFIDRLKVNLDKGTYGQHKAKNSIIEIMAKWISNPEAKGNVLGLCGPAGIGKTTLIKNGLSKALEIPFSFIPLGGSMSSMMLEGSDYTYEGSKWGRIVDILMENKCMNPIIFFDELDKISTDKNGDEITSLLIHLTDFSQNNSFSDKYFNGIDFDLSKCLIIFSFNDKNKINPILKDRINIIELEGFDPEDKVKIANDYSLDKICKDIGFNRDYIELNDETLKVIISTYCTEKGVRKLEQCLNSLVMKINLYHLTRDLKNLNVKDLNPFKNFETPYKITPERAIKLLDPIYRKDDMSLMIKMMYS